MDGLYLEIENFWSNEECDNYIKCIDKIFLDNLDEEAWEIDGYNRLRIYDEELSRLIEKKLSECYNVKNIYLAERWFPTKYIKGGNLCVHSDGSTSDENNVSSYTIIIYLNDDFLGGRTVFVNDYDDNEIVNEDSSYIEPKKGKLIMIKQDALHYAEKLISGEKYILRGDVFINK